MPTLRRSASVSSLGSLTSMPSTLIEPELIGVSALMHRSTVDLPDPEGPMMQIVFPLATLNVTSFRTSRAPKDLRMLSTMTTGARGSVVLMVLESEASEFHLEFALERNRPFPDRIA